MVKSSDFFMLIFPLIIVGGISIKLRSSGKSSLVLALASFPLSLIGFGFGFMIDQIFFVPQRCSSSTNPQCDGGGFQLMLYPIVLISSLAISLLISFIIILDTPNSEQDENQDSDKKL